jgi:hypothetical protein
MQGMDEKFRKELKSLKVNLGNHCLNKSNKNSMKSMSNRMDQAEIEHQDLRNKIDGLLHSNSKK